MKLNQLKALLAVAQAGSIQEGAKVLHLTQSALSKSIKELEREVGAEVLVRTARGAVLTECGQAMVRRSRAIELELGRMREEIEGLRGARGTRLVIGYSAPAVSSPLADTVASFIRQRPEVDVQLLELRGAQIAERLRERTLDLGIVGQYTMPGTDFHSHEVLSHEMVLVASDPGVASRPTLEQLSSHTWLSLDPPDDGSSFLATMAQRFQMAPPARIVHCASVPLFTQLVMRVPGVLHCMAGALRTLQPFFQDGSMRLLEPPCSLPAMKIVLQYPERDLLTPSAAEFAECYVHNCRHWNSSAAGTFSVAIPR